MIISKTKKYVYEKRIVAFVDVLGFKTIIKDSEADISLRRTIKKAMRIIYDVKKNNEYFEQKGIFVTTFSDSAVISYPANQDDGLFYMLIDIIHLQLKLGAIGFMIRGGITVGDVYHDHNIVFGPAMNEAYRLESELAIWPRVVIKPDVLLDGVVGTALYDNGAIKDNVKEIFSCVKPDIFDENNNANNIFDQLYFVDFLRQHEEFEQNGDEYYQWLRNFRSSIISGLNRYSEANEDFENLDAKEKELHRKVFKKYRWIMKYWNSVVTDEKASYPVPDIGVEQKAIFRGNYCKLKINTRFPYV